MTSVTSNKLTTRRSKWSVDAVQVIFSNMDIYAYRRILRETAELLVEHVRLVNSATKKEDYNHANHSK